MSFSRPGPGPGPSAPSLPFVARCLRFSAFIFQLTASWSMALPVFHGVSCNYVFILRIRHVETTDGWRALKLGGVFTPECSCHNCSNNELWFCPLPSPEPWMFHSLCPVRKLRSWSCGICDIIADWCGFKRVILFGFSLLYIYKVNFLRIIFI